MQVSQCLRYGAHVEQYGDNLAEAKQHAMKLAEAKKLKYING
jgi:threonine dehydratase